MTDQHRLLKSLRTLMNEIEDIQSKAATCVTTEERVAVEAELQSLINRKIAVEEEINQTTGAFR
jgi:hypothetical protein